MLRIIVALAVICAIAPTLIVVLSSISHLVIEPPAFSGSRMSSEDIPLSAVWLFHFLWTVLFIFPAALILALVYRMLGSTSQWTHIAGGVAIGLGAIVSQTSFFIPLRQDDGSIHAILTLLAYLFTGAVCGWIYWCIAVREQPIRYSVVQTEESDSDQSIVFNDISWNQIWKIGPALLASFILILVYFSVLIPAVSSSSTDAQLNSAFALFKVAQLAFTAALPLILLSLLLTFALKAIRLERWWSFTLGGVVIGFTTLALLSGLHTLTLKQGIPISLGGAFGGWIYWLIAIREAR